MATFCGVCYKPGSKLCSRCNYEIYCSRECQMKDWKNHKKQCLEALSEEKVKQFWDWFLANEDFLLHRDVSNNQIIAITYHMFKEAFQKIRPGDCLGYEIGPILGNDNDTRRELLIHASGYKKHFADVKAIIKAAPALDRWKFTALKQRNPKASNFNLCWEGSTLPQGKLSYALIKDDRPDKIGIVLSVQGYSEDREDYFMHIGFLYLDMILGEYDVETHVGIVDIRSSQDEMVLRATMRNDTFHPLTKLADDFDERLAAKIGPKPAGGWQALRGF